MHYPQNFFCVIKKLPISKYFIQKQKFYMKLSDKVFLQFFPEIFRFELGVLPYPSASGVSFPTCKNTGFFHVTSLWKHCLTLLSECGAGIVFRMNQALNCTTCSFWSSSSKFPGQFRTQLW